MERIFQEEGKKFMKTQTRKERDQIIPKKTELN